MSDFKWETLEFLKLNMKFYKSRSFKLHENLYVLNYWNEIRTKNNSDFYKYK